MRPATRLAATAIVVSVVILPGKSAEKTPVTIEDCIRMVRIQNVYQPNEPTVTFSPDGTRFAVVVWRGDLERNTNHYSLLVFDSQHLERPPQSVLTLQYSHDSEDQHATPIAQAAFIANNSAVAFLGRLNGLHRQVYAVDLRTKNVQQLTKHPNDVLAFGITPDGNRLVLAARAPEDAAARQRLQRDGFSLDEVGGPTPNLFRITFGEWLPPRLQWFRQAPGQAKPLLVHETAPKKSAYVLYPKVWMAPSGRLAAIHPYGSVSTDASIGLLHLDTGRMEDVGSALPSEVASLAWFHRVLWAPDERSLLVFARPDLFEIAIDRKRATRVSVGDAWELLGWDARESQLRFVRSMAARDASTDLTMATLTRGPRGWKPLSTHHKSTTGYGLNAHYYGATNEHIIIGVKDAPTIPPEVAAYAVESRSTHVLTDLDPQLAGKRFGSVERLKWPGAEQGEVSVGYLIKPTDYRPGRRAPLIVLLEAAYTRDDTSYVLDGRTQLGGAAIQVWANAGFAVLIAPGPRSVREVTGTPDEPKLGLSDLEHAIDKLVDEGIADRDRVALIGWSRSGYHTLYAISHARRPFAAASVIDNVQYTLNNYILVPGYWQDHKQNWGGLLPWGPRGREWFAKSLDFALNDVRTPLLMERYGKGSLLISVEVYAALKALSVPIDVYFFPGAAHNPKSPRHRWRSLNTHLDWFRFWLQNREDPDPNKRAQYERWRRLREEWRQSKASKAQSR